jgi:hypothetical protein
VPSDYLDAEQSDLHVPAVPPGFMREVVLEQCYSQPLAPRSRTVYYHYVETVLNPSPGSHVVLRTALLTEDTVEGFLRSHQGVQQAGLQHANFAFGDAVARGLPSIAPAQSTARAVTGPHTAQVATKRVGKSLPFLALKCAGCKRWHHVPEEVFNKVRCRPLEHPQHPHLLTVRRTAVSHVLSDGCAVQAMEMDGGISFKCADSSAWRKDCTCGTASDFMTAGQSHGKIPAVPKGFVRFVKLIKINKPKNTDREYRNVNYLYCGDADAVTVPDTMDWTPLCVEFTAKVASTGTKGGAQRIYALRPSPSCKVLTVEKFLQQHPRLTLTLDDFSFTQSVRALVAVADPTYTVDELTNIPTMRKLYETVRPALASSPTPP